MVAGKLARQAARLGLKKRNLGERRAIRCAAIGAMANQLRDRGLAKVQLQLATATLRFE